MKYFSTIKVIAATIALVVSSQLFADEQIEQYPKSYAEGERDIQRLKYQETENDSSVYVTGGGSFFSQDLGSTIGAGAAFRFAVGIQHNKWFGTELYTAMAPSLEPKAVVEKLRESTDQYISPFDINTRSNKYLGVVGKFSFDVNEHFSLVGKIGVAKYEAHRVSAEISRDEEAGRIQFPYRNVKGGVKGYSPVISFGFEVPFPDHKSEHGSAELMLTHMFDDAVESLSLNATLKYTF